MQHDFRNTLLLDFVHHLMYNWTTASWNSGLLLSSNCKVQEMHLLQWASQKELLSVTQPSAFVIILVLMESVVHMKITIWYELRPESEPLVFTETGYEFYVCNVWMEIIWNVFNPAVMCLGMWSKNGETDGEIN